MLAHRIRNGPDAAEEPKEKPLDSARELILLKAHIHSVLLDRLDYAKVEKLAPGELEAAITPMIRSVLADEGTPLTRAEMDRLTREIIDETVGLGPLEPLLADVRVSDILVSGPNRVWIERDGLLERTAVTFKDERHLGKIIDRIVSRVGRRVDESSPMVDARLPDGSRVNVVLRPLALDGAILSIRKFRTVPYGAEDLVALETVTPQLATFLRGCVVGRVNILISGGTGAGKTTLLNVLSRWVSPLERIVTIEDAAELQLQQEHVVRLETRIANIEGRGRVTQRELLQNSLRMRPDRIIIGECRGEEALDMLQAMNTGHEGSMTTLHANSTRDAIRRLETMVQLGGLELGTRTVRELIASSLHVIIQQQRFPDGKRHVTEVSEITGMEGDTVSLQPIFEWRSQGVDQQGRFRGKLRATGLRSHFTERIEQHGHPLPASLFQEEAS